MYLISPLSSFVKEMCTVCVHIGILVLLSVPVAAEPVLLSLLHVTKLHWMVQYCQCIQEQIALNGTVPSIYSGTNCIVWNSTVNILRNKFHWMEQYCQYIQEQIALNGTVLSIYSGTYCIEWNSTVNIFRNKLHWIEQY